MSDKKVCQEPGCGEPLKARGRCNSHYQSWRRAELKGGAGKVERVPRRRHPGVSIMEIQDSLGARLRAVLAERLAAI